MTETVIDRAPRREGPRPGFAGVLRRPGVWIGLALGVTGFVGLSPFEGWSPITWLLPVLALAYLAFGAFRHALRRPGVLPLQLAGVVLFTALALVATAVDPALGQYVVAVGYLGHAAWDYFHRDGTVVPKWYVEFCVVYDVLVAVSLIVAATLF